MAEGIKPDSITFNALIDAAGAARRTDQAQRILEEMQQPPFSLRPDINHYNALIEALARNNQLEEAERVLDSLLERPDSLLRPTAKTFSSLLSFLITSSNDPMRKRLVMKMKRAQVAPDGAIQRHLKLSSPESPSRTSRTTKGGSV